MSRLNLGCGLDFRPDYENVDFKEFLNRPHRPTTIVDLSKLPWPWKDRSVEEVLMLDFLEHFPYRQTENILGETWRILQPRGFVDIQVPDFEHCARAAIRLIPYKCNVCGYKFDLSPSELRGCPQCHQTHLKIADAAVRRLYGGQDYTGNWHFTAFTKELLEDILKRNGFGSFQYLEAQHQYDNWNFKIRAFKTDDVRSE